MSGRDSPWPRGVGWQFIVGVLAALFAVLWSQGWNSNVETKSTQKEVEEDDIYALPRNPGQSSFYKVDFEWEETHIENAAIVIVTSDPRHLRTTLSTLERASELSRFKVYISALNEDVKGEANKITSRVTHLIEDIWTFPELQDLDEENPGVQSKHMHLSVERVFETHEYSIILQDNLLPAPDFLMMFDYIGSLLKTDSSLCAISAWNDNSLGGAVANEELLLRSDYFPGKAWMTSREIWKDKFATVWPLQPRRSWDDTMRSSGSLGDCAFIIPLVSRVKLLPRKGLSERDVVRIFGELAFSSSVPYEKKFGPPNFLQKVHYDKYLKRMIARSPRATLDNYTEATQPSKEEKRAPDSVVVLYDRSEYTQVARHFGLWEEERRGGYRGVVLTGDGSSILTHKRPFIILVERGTASDLLGMDDTNSPFKSVVSAIGESCSQACSGEGRCLEAALPGLNTCSAMKDFWECSGGCSSSPSVAGLPGFWESEGGHCLLSSRDLTCDASDPHVARLCPCALAGEE